MDQFPPPPPPPVQPPPPPVPPLQQPATAPDPTEIPWRAREGVLIGILALLTGGFVWLVLTAIVTPHGNPTEKQESALALWAMVIIQGALVLWLWVWLKLRYRVGLRRLGLRYRPGDLAAGVAAAVGGLAAVWIVSGIANLISRIISGDDIPIPDQLPPLHGTTQLIFAAAAAIIVAPVTEEMFFRGFIYQALRRWRGVPFAVILSAAVFAITHIAPLLIIGIFPLGIIFAYLFERRASLGATIVAHMTYNLIGFIFIVSSG
jgi:uncharacterized protein